jgi:phenylalanyl-tRNA synthetase beta chain
MRVPLSWLADYVELKLPVEEMAHRLTMAGLEVKGVERSGGDWAEVVVGRVLAVAPHPNADRLRLATVELPGEQHTVVCGAPNVAVGQRIAFARLGAKLIDGHSGKPFVLKKATIRGVESAGMVCSEKELGLSEEHEGILVLPEDAPLGARLTDVLSEVVLEIDMKPNRADGLSILGVARDVAALTGARVNEPPLDHPEQGEPIEERVAVEIEDVDLCSRYVATLVEGIRIAPSPDWMQRRLRAAGMRPINNVVDISNYVMLELGQPLHAFDYDTLSEGRIIVRRARPGETLTTLDEAEHAFTSEHLLITDPSGPVAVAGVMGGLNTEVTEKTTRVLLESATFNQVSIRRTAAALKVPSEASRRFAWGLPPELAALAARRATRFLVELAGGRAAAGVADCYPAKAEPVRIQLKGNRVSQVLGVEVPSPRIVSTLSSLGFRVESNSSDAYRVEVPYWRRDVRIPDDLVEEVARVVGYDQIPTEPLAGRVPPRVPQPLRDLRERVRDILAGAGMQEVITYPLLSQSALEQVVGAEVLAARAPLAVLNPLQAGNERLRLSLRASLLGIVALNQRQQDNAIAIYETSRVYLPRPEGLPQELEQVAGAVSGRRMDRWGHATSEPVDFFDAKGYVARLFERLGLEVDYVAREEFSFVPGRTAEIRVAGKSVGLLGQIHPATAARFEVKQDVFFFEVVLDEVLPLLSQKKPYRALFRFPPVVEDLAVVVGQEITAAEAQSALLAHPLVVSAGVFDEYTGPPVPPGKKSLAFSVCYQAPDRTLTEAEVAKARERILERLRKEFKAELRS